MWAVHADSIPNHMTVAVYLRKATDFEKAIEAVSNPELERLVALHDASTIAAVIVSLIALTVGWHTALLFAIPYVAYLQFEAYFISPRIMQRAVAVPGAVGVTSPRPSLLQRARILAI